MPDANVVDVYNPYADYSDELPPLPQGRSFVPRIELCQTTSVDAPGFNVPYGNFYLRYQNPEPDSETATICQDLGATIEVMPLRAKGDSRELFVKGEAVCRAHDGKRGFGTPGGDCSVCPQAKWQENGDAPPCKLVSHLLLYCPPLEIPVEMRFKSSSRKAYNEIVTALHRKGGYGRVAYMLASERVIQPGETFFKPVATAVSGERVAELYANGQIALTQGFNPNSKPALGAPPAAAPPKPKAPHWVPPNQRQGQASPAYTAVQAGNPDIDDLPF